MQLTQGDIPKIMELIVRQLPITSYNTASNSTQALAAGTHAAYALFINKKSGTSDCYLNYTIPLQHLELEGQPCYANGDPRNHPHGTSTDGERLNGGWRQ